VEQRKDKKEQNFSDLGKNYVDRWSKNLATKTMKQNFSFRGKKFVQDETKKSVVAPFTSTKANKKSQDNSQSIKLQKCRHNKIRSYACGRNLQKL
jgi:hypothetical protein